MIQNSINLIHSKLSPEVLVKKRFTKVLGGTSLLDSSKIDFRQKENIGGTETPSLINYFNSDSSASSIQIFKMSFVFDKRTEKNNSFVSNRFNNFYTFWRSDWFVFVNKKKTGRVGFKLSVVFYIEVICVGGKKGN